MPVDLPVADAIGLAVELAMAVEEALMEALAEALPLAEGLGLDEAAGVELLELLHAARATQATAAASAALPAAARREGVDLVIAVSYRPGRGLTPGSGDTAACHGLSHSRQRGRGETAARRSRGGKRSLSRYGPIGAWPRPISARLALVALNI
jgi:hypothetical protein